MQCTGLRHSAGPHRSTSAASTTSQRWKPCAQALGRRSLPCVPLALHRQGSSYSPPAADGEALRSSLTQPRQYRDSEPAHGGASGCNPGATVASSHGPTSVSTAATAASSNESTTHPTSAAADSEVVKRRLVESPDDDAALSRQGKPIWPRGNLTAVVLGGGEMDSRRLFPLTQFRTLPAIPFGGPYRIIDVLMSNLLNSGVNKIHILTAYNSYSLNRHLQRTYDMSGGVPYGGDGYIEVVANTMSPDSQQWHTGTAGCVRQFMSYFDSNPKNRFIEDVLILPGDHIYSTDLTPIIAYHHKTGADLTVVCRPVSGDQASRLGVVKLDSDMRVSAFTEKPDPDQLQELAMTDEEMRPFMTGGPQRPGSSAANPAEDGLRAALALWTARGRARVGGGAGGRMVLDTMSSGEDVELSQAPGYVGSTGIYIFRRSVLSEILKRHYKSRDFGREIIPEIIREGCKVYAYRLPGYWADVGGSVGDFYQANMALLGDHPSISFNRPVASPMFRFPVATPATQLLGARISRSIVSSGCMIHDAAISSSVVGPRSIIGSRVTMSDSIVMGADHYEHEKPQQRPLSPTYPPMGIGEDSVVRRAIVDLNCRVGRGVSLVNKEGVYESFDRAVQGMYVRDGITVVTREAVVPDGTVF